MKELPFPFEVGSTQGDPHTPNKGIASSMNMDFEAASNQEVLVEKDTGVFG
jgi:hypothetical protein